MRIAVIGGGISGNVAAYKLHAKHDVVLFEANDYVGGHTHTVDVSVGGRDYAIDTGFIVFNHATYPEFTRLLTELQVQSQPTRMSFSVRCEDSGLEYGGVGLNGLFAQRGNLVNPRFYQLLRDFFRFSKLAREIMSEGEANETVGSFLTRHRFSDAFRRWYFMPMGSAVWSCPREAFEDFPIRFVAEFYHNHGMLNAYKRPLWQVIRGGSRTYVQAMLKHFRGEVRTNTEITSVQRTSTGVEIVPKRGSPETFDHVILACHADQALKMLGENAEATEQEILRSFPYEENSVVLHTDASVMPRSRRAWASWNYRCGRQDANSTNAKATVTYNMNMLQGIEAPETFLVTLNNPAIDPKKILRTFTYHHPVFDVRRYTAQARHDEMIDRRGISFCGAYWKNGFHEDGVVSALRVCQVIDKLGDHAQRTLHGLGAASTLVAG